ncbi:MFS transporter [Staphylococcus gallinarum]|uniref:Melibiose carrier protein n=3 Tax=Staphylococcus gallinarum TaxID=1293 RepID=A0ABQ0XYB0_STAGA|nr:glycoside-pentoside-hexuronide (GPH):cation symporter [Staphylococcus gallinarum]GEQ04246.1 melibiose carrier protein [Staphylococcus gallinarum]
MGDASRKFNYKDKLAYLYGDLANTIILGLVNSFLMIYFTNVLGITGYIVGILFFTTRIIDAFVDVLIGRLCDNSKVSKEGRFRPWIRKMKYPFCISTIILFLPFINDFSMNLKIIYAFISYLLFGILLSAINIPYGSMASTITSDVKNRASLSTFRSIGAAIGGSSTGLLIPLFVYINLPNGHQIVSGNRFFIVSIICAIIAFFFYKLTYKNTVERIQFTKKEIEPINKIFISLFKNKALIALVIVDIFIVINQILTSTNITYLFHDFYHNKTAMSIALFLNYGTVILLAPFSTLLATKYGKKEVSIIALLFSSVLYLTLYFLNIQNVWLYLFLMFLATLGASLFNLMIWAFISDVIDYHQYTTYLREDGTIYAVNSFARKIGQSLAGGLGGILLSIIGYNSSKNSTTTQTDEVMQRIYDMSNLSPSILLFISFIILALFYPLNKSTVTKISNVLNVRNNKNQ